MLSDMVESVILLNEDAWKGTRTITDQSRSNQNNGDHLHLGYSYNLCSGKVFCSNEYYIVLFLRLKSHILIFFAYNMIWFIEPELLMLQSYRSQFSDSATTGTWISLIYLVKQIDCSSFNCKILITTTKKNYNLHVKFNLRFYTKIPLM